jgi:hypothetical protein
LCTTNSHTIRKSNGVGSSTTIIFTGSASGSSGSTDGVISSARFNSPSTISIDSLTNIYVADTGNDKIRKVTILSPVASSTVSTLVGTSSAGYNGDNILAVNARLNAPSGIDLDTLGNLYIADTGNNRIRFVNITTNIITTLTTGYTPQYIDVDKYGNSYFTDQNTNRL